MAKQELNIKNKKARFEFEILDTFDAGMVLSGTEIKSIRAGKASIVEAYCFMQGEELYVKNMHVAIYNPGSYNNHDPLRVRKLLLKHHELEKIAKKLKDQGITLIPLRIYLSDSGFAKMEIGLARGKKLHDKRDDLKQKDVKREIDRAKSFRAQ